MSDLLEVFDEHVRGFAQSELSDCALTLNFTLGLFGEAGEVTDLLKKYLYHGDELDEEKLIKECGDVMWYWVALLQRLEQSPIEQLWMLTPIAKYTSTEEELGAFILPMATATGKIAAMMDAHFYYGDRLDLDAFLPEMRNILRNLFYILNYFDITLETVLEANIAKLKARHFGTKFDRQAQRLSKAAEVEAHA